TSFANESLSGGDIAEALEFLEDMLGDDAFRTARLALDAYGLTFGGGLKNETLAVVKDQWQTAAWGAMPRMHAWVINGKSEREAAKISAAELGVRAVKSARYEAAIDSLRKTYPLWLKSVKNNEPCKVHDGDTGRKLRVRFARTWLGADNQPITELMSVKFDGNGFGLAPDNREWRRLIHAGYIALYGVLELGKSSPE